MYFYSREEPQGESQSKEQRSSAFESYRKPTTTPSQPNFNHTMHVEVDKMGHVR